MLICVAGIGYRGAKVNRATFYAHFPDKYALMDSLIREQFQHIVVGKLPPAPGRGSQALQALIRAVFDFLGQFSSEW